MLDSYIYQTHIQYQRKFYGTRFFLFELLKNVCGYFNIKKRYSLWERERGGRRKETILKLLISVCV